MFVALVASTCALHMPAMMLRRAIVTMSDSDNMAIPDPNFVGDELANTWERAGKGKRGGSRATTLAMPRSMRDSYIPIGY